MPTSTAPQATFNRQGLNDEKTVIKFLQDQGYDVIACDDQEMQFKDIDAIVNGRTVSIKSSHDGWKYKNIVLELTSQRQRGRDWANGAEFKYVYDLAIRSFKPVAINRTYKPSWYLTGEAEYYLFWQQDILMMFAKQDIKDHVAANGFARVLGLKPDTLRGQGFMNTVSGYLDLADIEYLMLDKWDLHLPENRKAKYRINPL